MWKFGDPKILHTRNHVHMCPKCYDIAWCNCAKPQADKLCNYCIIKGTRR